MPGQRGRYRGGRDKHRREMIRKFDCGELSRISESLGWTLVDDLIRSVSIRPYDSIALIEMRRAILRALSMHNKRMIACMEVAFLCVESTALRTIGETCEAEDKLSEAMKIAAGCVKCEAEIFRLQGILFVCMGDSVRANKYSMKAVSAYESISGEGHNRSGNARFSCTFTRAVIDLFNGDIESAIARNRIVLEGIDPRVSGELFIGAITSLAFCLVKRGDSQDIEEAALRLDNARSKLRGVKGPTVSKACIDWLRGMVRARLGSGRADRILRSSRDQFMALRMTQESIMVTADIFRLRLTISRSVWFARDCLNKIRGIIPPIAESLYLKILELSDDDSKVDLAYRSVSELRDLEIEKGRRGNSVMPCLLPEIDFI